MSLQHCCDLLRRNAIAAHPTLNGIDWIEVLDRDLPDNSPLRQRSLLVRCLKPLATFNADNILIEGGERLREIQLEWAARAQLVPAELAAPGEAAVHACVQAMTVAERNQTLIVRCAAAGDFSTYRLRLQASATDASPPPDFDPRMSTIEFRFKVECNPEFDCKEPPVCTPAPSRPQDIDYLARDYPSFRRLLLDRIAQKAPSWKLDQVPDGGMALVELLAYVGDQLSYRQDAIGTEAYLNTARKRVSLRRHATLVDYAMHDGCNARAFVHVRLQSGVPTINLSKQGTLILTRCADLPAAVAPDSDLLPAAMRTAPQIFEPMLDTVLHADHNQIAFHTWSDERCCLPRGATRATLLGSHWALEPGDFLLFEEVLGPLTGLAADADPAHRHIVRLTTVSQGTQAEPMRDPLPATVTPICEIAWAEEDALPFPLCLSSITDEAHGARKLAGVSVARGNLVLADHGQTQADERLGRVPAATLFLAQHGERCEQKSVPPLPVRYRPQLGQGPLTCAAALPGSSAPAIEFQHGDVSRAMPQITLKAVGATQPWTVVRSLLDSLSADSHFVAEIDDEGRARLRFGDDHYGQRPNAGAVFEARYRIGQGSAGNVGAESLVHLVCADHASIETVRNPLAARGGVDPEGKEPVRRRAPQAFRTQQRAVTEADYAAVTQRHRGVQRAQSRLRWTGSWHTVFTAVDRVGGVPLSDAYEAELVEHVDRYRMAGHDLEFDEPIYVPLGIALHVCVKPDYFRAHVRVGLLEVLGSRRLADGRVGLFHPDRFSFGQTVYLSPIYAAAHTVPGVDSIRVTALGPQDAPSAAALADGKLELGRLQIARLDNDPNFPEHGRLSLELDGGK